MNKELFIKVAFEDISLLIDNYLSNGMVSSYNRWEDIEGFIYEKFPCLSVAFLMRENCPKEDYVAFLNRYNQQISSEVERLKGSLLTDVDVEILSLKKRIDELTKERTQLQELCKGISKEKNELKKQLCEAHDEIAKLKEIISLIENNHKPIPILTKEQIVSIWSNFTSLPYINDNAIVKEENFDIDGFIKALISDFSINISKDEIRNNNSLLKIVNLIKSKQTDDTKAFQKLQERYPQKKEYIKELDARNIIQIILSCCPETNGATHKYIFESDTLTSAQLNAEKLDAILSDNFGIKWSSVEGINSAKNIGELKDKILIWQKRKISPLALAGVGAATAAVVAAANEVLKKSIFTQKSLPKS